MIFVDLYRGTGFVSDVEVSRITGELLKILPKVLNAPMDVELGGVLKEKDVVININDWHRLDKANQDLLLINISAPNTPSRWDNFKNCRDKIENHLQNCNVLGIRGIVRLVLQPITQGKF